jgi:alpha-beta hydrolase superfamily lysophospholipase
VTGSRAAREAQVGQRRVSTRRGVSLKTRHGFAEVDGLKIFYREAGADTSPALLLLHGFPTSSHMFRDLIPALADDYHVVAPDLPGFGFSEAPDRAQFRYTFDHLADVIDRFTTVAGSPVMPCTSSTTARRLASARRRATRSGSPQSSRRTATPMRRG